jgi:hypothetical protein
VSVLREWNKGIEEVTSDLYTRYNSLRTVIGVLIGIEIAIMFQVVFFIHDHDNEIYSDLGVAVVFFAILVIILLFVKEIDDTSELMSVEVLMNEEQQHTMVTSIKKCTTLESTCLRLEMVIILNMALFIVGTALIISDFAGMTAIIVAAPSLYLYYVLFKLSRKLSVMKDGHRRIIENIVESLVESKEDLTESNTE